MLPASGERVSYPSWRIGIVVGFATAVAMWLIAFFLHLQGLTAHPRTTGLALILCQIAGGLIAGRFAMNAFSAGIIGLFAGLTTSMLNLLILGSVLTEPARTKADEALRPDAGLMVGGYLLLGAVIGVIAASIGRRLLKPARNAGFNPSHDPWITRFAWVAALAVVPVLFTGGLTTSNQAGLAVPDWPNTYATNMFLYPVSSMTGGKLYEHSHRLFGALAGFTVLGLFLFSMLAWIREPRAERATRSLYGWATLLSLGAGFAVLTQAIIGGLRVIYADGADDEEAWSSAIETMPEISRSLALTTDNEKSIGLAVVHGITGQLTFALLCVMACVLSWRWRSAAAVGRPSDSLLRWSSAAFLIAAVLQLSLGSVVRHLQHFHAVYAHIGFAVIVTGLAMFAGARAIARHTESWPLNPLGKALLGTVCVQFVLGWVALMFVVPHYDEHLGTTPLTAERPASSVLAATAHQMTGAALLAVGAMLVAWAFRLTTARQPVEPSGSALDA